MANDRQSPTEHIVYLTLISGAVFVSTISAESLYLIGEAVIDSWPTPLPILNGILCIIPTIFYNFEFQLQIPSLVKQFKTANGYGKSLMMGSTLLTIVPTGIPNCYYTIGNKFFKIIALLVPGLAANSLIIDWTLRAHLAIRNLFQPKTYKTPYELQRLLNTFLSNLRYNKKFRADFSNKQNFAQLKAALTTGNFSEISRELESAISHQNFIVTDFQLRWRTWGSLFMLLKFGGIITLGFFASKDLYEMLGPKAGACIFGSSLEQDSYTNSLDDCPITSNTLESVGRHLGEISYATLTTTIIFPMLGTIDMSLAAANNPWNFERYFTYAAAFIIAGCRTTVTEYIQSQNSEGTDYTALIYVGVVFFIYNFFSTAGLGPNAVKTLIRTFTSAGKSLWHACKQSSEEKETLVESDEEDITPYVTHSQATKTQCLLHPEEVNTKFTYT